MFEVTVERMFAAAHALRDYKGSCERTHGHNWRVRVTLEGEKVDKTGMLADFIDVKGTMDRVIGYLDHQFLNEIQPFDVVNPSAENIAKWIHDELSNLKGDNGGAEWSVSKVQVWETDDCSAIYRLR